MSGDRSPFEVIQRRAGALERDVVDLVSGFPEWDPPPALRDGLRAYADSAASNFDYPPVAGLRDLREWIADHHDVPREQVLVTTGASEANFLATAAALAEGSGDTVLVPDPSYPYYAERVRLLDGDVRRLPLGPSGEVDPDGLDALDDETAAILINTPNNPTGAVYDHSTMEDLAACADRVAASLISDEVYAPFDRSGTFTSARAVTADAVVVGGFSKSLAITGFRVGYGLFPQGLLETARRYHRVCTLTASRPAQAAVLAALTTDGNGRDLRSVVAGHRQRLADRETRLKAALTAGGAEVVDPAGGFYLLADLPGVEGTVDGVTRMLRGAGVAAMPGAVFGETTAEHVRFSLTSSRVETAADRLERWLTST